MNSRNGEKNPDCFGILEQVFPMGEDGLRKSPESCMCCGLKTECLRAAMSGISGIKVREESLDRGFRSGSVGFFERWSRKKHLKRELDKRKKKTQGENV